MNATSLSTLRSIDVRNAASDKRLNGLIRLATLHFGLDMVVIALHDACGQHLCAYTGFASDVASQALSMSAARMQKRVVQDTCTDSLLQSHPLVTGTSSIRFFAECPLITSDGQQVGVFCLFDRRARTLDATQLAFLEELAQLAAVAFERDVAIEQLSDEELAARESEQRDGQG